MPKGKGTEPQTYSSVLKTIQDMGGKKKASALLPAMRSMTKYLYKADQELLDATAYHILFFHNDNIVVFLYCTFAFSSYWKGR